MWEVANELWFIKALVLIVVLLNIASPIEVCPEAHDDIIVAIHGIVARKRLSTN